MDASKFQPLVYNSIQIPLQDEPVPCSILSNSQQRLLDLMIKGYNVYFTGKAGTGKSFVIKRLVDELQMNNKKFVITATTGVAASLIDGRTFHSFSSIISDNFHRNLKHINSSSFRVKNYATTQVLVIDEVSMLHPSLLDMFNRLCKAIRKNNKPFGGMQIILSGDFFQLPPVCKNLERINPESSDYTSSSAVNFHFFGDSHEDMKDTIVSSKCESETVFAFDSKAWRELEEYGMKTAILNESFRQQDPEFVAILDDIRSGILTPKLWDCLRSFKDQHRRWGSNTNATILSAFRASVHDCNLKNLNSLRTSSRQYSALEIVKAGTENLWNLCSDERSRINYEFDQFQAQNVLHLKVGARVLLLKNLSVKQKLVNGSVGTVIDFKTSYDHNLQRVIDLPVVQFSCGNSYIIGYYEFSTHFGDTEPDKPYILRRYQIPLKLGWAVTIHKAQGMNLDRAILDLPSSFAPGHAYVAMSRVKYKDGLSFYNFAPNSIFVSSKINGLCFSNSDSAFHQMATISVPSIPLLQQCSIISTILGQIGMGSFLNYSSEIGCCYKANSSNKIGTSPSKLTSAGVSVGCDFRKDRSESVVSLDIYGFSGCKSNTNGISFKGLDSLRDLRMNNCDFVSTYFDWNAFAYAVPLIKAMLKKFNFRAISGGFTGNMDVDYNLMSSLTHIDVKNNFFYGYINPSFGALDWDFIDLSNNFFSGEFPVLQKNNLKYLNLNSSGIAGQVDLSQMKNLTGCQMSNKQCVIDQKNAPSLCELQTCGSSLGAGPSLGNGSTGEGVPSNIVGWVVGGIIGAVCIYFAIFYCIYKPITSGKAKWKSIFVIRPQQTHDEVEVQRFVVGDE